MAKGEFPDYEDICREILLVDYPEEVPHESAQALDELSWENILDEVVFMKEGRLLLQTSVEEIREEKGKSVDAYFREVFAC